MPDQTVAYLLSKDLPLVTTEKEITAFGGLSLIARYFRRIGLIEALKAALPEEVKTSNNSIYGMEIALAFLVGVLRGAHRFAHVAMLRWDAALQKVFPKIPTVKTQIYPLWLDVLVVAAFGVVMLIIAIWEFNRQE